MADQQSKVPPRSAAATRRNGGRPPAPPRKRPTKRGRRGFPRRYLYGIAALVVAAAVVVAVLVATSGSSKGPSAANYSLADGTKVYGPLGPEKVPMEVGPALAPANTGLTGATIDGIQCSSSEQLVYHHHVHLAFFVDGKPYSMPYGVGMVPPLQVSQSPQGAFADGGTCLYWTHVHAQDGVVHIESPEVRNFQLGQVMDIWHVAIGNDQLGSYKGKVTATVNGKPWTGDLRQIPLTEHAQIVVNVGGPVVSPPPINWGPTGL